MDRPNDNPFGATSRAPAVSLDYSSRSDVTMRPAVLTAVGVLSIAIGLAVGALTGLFVLIELLPARWVAFAPSGDAPRPFDLTLPFGLTICASFLTAIWLLIAGIRLFASHSGGIFDGCRMHRIYVVAGLALALAWAALQIANDFDIVGGPLPATERISDGIVWLLTTGAYPAALIFILRSRRVAAYCRREA